MYLTNDSNIDKTTPAADKLFGESDLGDSKKKKKNITIILNLLLQKSSLISEGGKYRALKTHFSWFD